MGFFDFLKSKAAVVKRGYLSTYDQEVLKGRWKNIEDLLAANNPSSRRQAVLEADKVLDYALDRLYPGLTATGERLKLAREIFKYKREIYDQVWFAHKVRNEMVHNLNFEMPVVEAAATAEKIKAGLLVLGASL
ncbi:MAG: hypothetical protein Q8P13_03705 [bacterium]|nr:hypothetical protein [bacterium]